MTIARKIAIMITVLKNTFGFTFANSEDGLEGIIPPRYSNDNGQAITAKIRHSQRE
ncbi:hypothetical protein GCM10011446_31180 [Acinetobacter vivianii]|nr:hypothetical protein GCM10011446_31180 [Acinetobacter vivianii]